MFHLISPVVPNYDYRIQGMEHSPENDIKGLARLLEIASYQEVAAKALILGIHLVCLKIPFEHPTLN